MKKEKYLMIGASTGSRELLQDAKQTGCYTIAAGPEGTRRSIHSLGADEIWVVDTSDVDELERRSREAGVTAVMAGISAFNLNICIELCKRLGLPFYSSSDSRSYENSKIRFKELAKASGAPVSPDYQVSVVPTKEELRSIEYPVVVKAINLSANRGMTFVYNEEQLIPAIELARNLSGKEKVIVEKLLTGKEYGVHYIIADGEPELLFVDTMLSQPGYPTSCYSLTLMESDQLASYIESVDPYVRKMIEMAGVREGICWFELMEDKGNLFLLEMGYRLSGVLNALCAKHLCDFDEHRWLNEISRGIRHSKTDLPAKLYLNNGGKCSASYVIWSNERAGTIGEIEGVDRVSKLQGVTVEQWLKPGDVVEPYRYMMILIINASNVDELIDTIKIINDIVRIRNTEGDNIAIFFDDYNQIRMIHEQYCDQTKQLKQKVGML